MIAVPEPDLEPQTLVERARALIPAVRDQQDEAERLGHHTAELDRKFTEAGFYRILQPRRFGGYAFGLPTFWRVMLAVAEGDPGTGWALTLGAHHVLTVGAWFSEAGQRDIFGSSGEFSGPHRALPSGTAEPADGGYVVRGTWDYCSGSAHATHFMCNAMVAGTNEGGRGGGRGVTAVMPMDQVTVLDDWGGGATLGLNSSGSNSVRVDDVFVPGHWTAPADWTHGQVMAPGAALHGPLYCGRIYALYHAGLVIPVIGAARAALAERWARTGEPFTREDDVRLYAMIQQAGQLAAQAVQEIFAASSSSAAKRGTRLQRYYRDVGMYHGHIASQHLTTAAELARVHFDLPDSLF